MADRKVVQSTEKCDSKDECCFPENTRESSSLWVGILSCSLDMPLIELQRDVLHLIHEKVPLLARNKISTIFGESTEEEIDIKAYGAILPESMEDFVLREIRDDPEELPGRCLWIRGGSLVPPEHQHVDNDTSGQVVATGAAEKQSRSVNKKAASSRTKSKLSFTNSLAALTEPVLAKSAPEVTKSTIRRVKLASGSRKLIAQQLPFGTLHSTIVPADGCIRLWVYKGIFLKESITAHARELSYQPVGKPFDVFLNGGAMPSLARLKRILESEIDISFSSQRVFKLFSGENIWKDVSALAQKKSKNGLENLLLVPFSFKEGDSLCVFDATECNVKSSSDSLMPHATTFVVDRPIDQQRRLAAVEGAGGGVRGKKKKQNQQEIALKLTGDFDFSEDEDEH